VPKGGGRLDLIFKCSCLKAFTRSPLLTPVPRRSNADCDKIDAKPRRCSPPFACLSGLLGRAEQDELLPRKLHRAAICPRNRACDLIFTRDRQRCGEGASRESPVSFSSKLPMTRVATIRDLHISASSCFEGRHPQSGGCGGRVLASREARAAAVPMAAAATSSSPSRLRICSRRS